MVDGPKLPAGTSNAKTPQIQVAVILAMHKSLKYPDECFFNPRINKSFTVNQESLISKAN